MSVKMLKAIAVIFMLLALGWVVGAVSATTKSAQIQGPSALAVLPDQSVWLSVEDALWHLDSSGRRIAVVDGATLGVGGRIGNLVVHPNGQLVAQVRNDPTLYFLDPATALIKARLLPQWQPDLSRHSNDAINYAFHDDGRVAIATGGGHAVAVFDAAGRFLGRTSPGAYEFTNGLWWAGEALWTTDTNRQQLVVLDGTTLAEKSRVQLSKNCGGYQFLGMAAPSHGMASEDTKSAPLITLVRFANGMTKGRASDIFSDGSQIDFPVPVGTEPRDIRWLGNELLMVDGKSFSIKRYSADRASLADFGDAEVRGDLGSALAQRDNLKRQYGIYLGGAICFFIIGFAFAIRAQARERAQALDALKVDLSRLGTPVLTAGARFVASLKLFWPLLFAMGVLALVPLLIPQAREVARPFPEAALIVLFLLPLLTILAFFRRFRHRGNDPVIEAVFNANAVQFLKADTFWRMQQPGELPQETMMLAGTKGGLVWLVLTNQRLLVFASNLRDRTLAHAYLRSEVRNLRIVAPGDMDWRQKLQRFSFVVGGPVCFEFTDGPTLSGFAISTSVALRMSEEVRSSKTVSPVAQAPQALSARAKRRPVADMAMRQTVASLLIPGLGQWMQRRSGTALLYFVIWLFVLMLVVTVAWTLWKSLAAVSTRSIITAAGYYLAVCGLAAVDTWRMRER